MNPAVVVIGVGNPYRRDDGIGRAVVTRLHRRHLPGVTLAECDGEPRVPGNQEVGCDRCYCHGNGHR